MTRFKPIIIGSMLTFLSAWCGLVLLPIWGLGNFEQQVDPESGELIPPELTARERLGRAVYIANGCNYCHSQQVHPPRVRTDIARGWGERRSLPQDYMTQETALLGTMRTGPDLANIGVRNPSEAWHLMHLYDPQITSEGSNMPPFPFLFEVREHGPDGPSAGALPVPEEFSPGEGLEVVPTEDALALVAYLQSLKLSTHEFPEAERARREAKLP